MTFFRTIYEISESELYVKQTEIYFLHHKLPLHLNHLETILYNSEIGSEIGWFQIAEISYQN